MNSNLLSQVKRKLYGVFGGVGVIIVAVVWMYGQDLVGSMFGPPSDKAVKHFCDQDLILKCHAANDAYGNISADVVIEINGNGEISGVKVKGQVPKTVSTCIEKEFRAIKPIKLDASPGAVSCQVSGMYNKGTQMLSFNASASGFTKK
jgi:hypothetical protein